MGKSFDVIISKKDKHKGWVQIDKRKGITQNDFAKYKQESRLIEDDAINAKFLVQFFKPGTTEFVSKIFLA